MARRSWRKTTFLEGLFAVFIAGVVLVAMVLHLGLDVTVEDAVRLAAIGVAATLAVHVLSVGIAKANERFAPKRSPRRTSSTGKKSAKPPRVPRGIARRIDRRAGRRIRKHAALLSRKRSRCYAGEGRGVIDQAKWRREQDEFIDKVVLEGVDSAHRAALKRRSGLVNAWRRRMEAAANEHEHQRANIHGVDFRPGMEGGEYEAYCARILNEAGWKVWNKGDSGDQGVDVVAERGGVIIAIQCKRYRGSVGNSAVQEIFAGRLTVSPQARAAVVSNASYTRSAKELANATGVFLLHHDDLTRLGDIIEAGRPVLKQAA